ncbi:MAG TPA: F0F1 ATP synthase subunit I [Chromatiales bacterium]|nr:F0F1 ATP synthase subunit I [Chromatiales bacterium]
MGDEQALRSSRKAAWRLAGWQLAVTVCIASGAVLIGGRAWAVSALSGGGIGIVAGLYQALRMFRTDISQHPERFLSSVYVSEALKILLTVALFVAAIRLLRVELVPVIVAYAATYAVYWAALGTGYPWLNHPADKGGATGQDDG